MGVVGFAPRNPRLRPQPKLHPPALLSLSAISSHYFTGAWLLLLIVQDGLRRGPGQFKLCAHFLRNPLLYPAELRGAQLREDKHKSDPKKYSCRWGIS